MDNQKDNQQKNLSKILLVGDKDYCQKIVSCLTKYFNKINPEPNWKEKNMIEKLFVENKYFRSELLVEWSDIEGIRKDLLDEVDCIIFIANEYSQKFLENLKIINLDDYEFEVKILLIDSLKPEKPQFNIETYLDTLGFFIEIIVDNLGLMIDEILKIGSEELKDPSYERSGVLRIIEALENGMWKNYKRIDELSELEKKLKVSDLNVNVNAGINQNLNKIKENSEDNHDDEDSEENNPESLGYTLLQDDEDSENNLDNHLDKNEGNLFLLSRRKRSK